MKIHLIVGTRPEAIKMAGLVYELRRRSDIDWKLISTGQHGSMLAETLADLGLEPHIDLAVMKRASGLAELTAEAMRSLAPVIAADMPDWVLVQGDTTTALVGALAAFYARVPVGHVEAGLRSGQRYSPWPEEINRRMIAPIAARHYAPTHSARDNLRAEGIPGADILVTGNTVIDALLHTLARSQSEPDLKASLAREFAWLDPARRMILVTGHRRESFGDGFREICLALKSLARRQDVEIVYPVHLNPQVRGPVHDILGDVPRIHLIEPLAYASFVHLMARAHILLTDSGGVQEEGPSLGKPVLVMRETSERREAIEAGSARLVGAHAATIIAEVGRLLDDANAYVAMSPRANPYGDGRASQRIIADLLR